MNKFFTCITVMASAVTFLTPDAEAATTLQIPTTPSINELNVDTENNDFYIVNTIKATDTQGNALDITKLYYIVRYKTGKTVEIYQFKSSYYYSFSKYTESTTLVEMPYLFDNDLVNYAGGIVSFPLDVPDEIGLQSVYYGEDYRSFSDICWYNTKAETSSIETLSYHHKPLRGFDGVVSPTQETVLEPKDLTVQIYFPQFDHVELLEGNCITATQDSYSRTCTATVEPGSNCINVAISGIVKEWIEGTINLRIGKRVIKGFDADDDFELNDDRYFFEWKYQKPPLDMTVNPAEGAVTELSTIDITVADMAYVDFSYNNSTTLTRNGENVDIDLSSENNHLYITPRQKQTNPGHYVLNIPAYDFAYYETYIPGEDNTGRMYTKDVSYAWDIEGPDFETRTTTPAEGKVDFFNDLLIDFTNLYDVDLNDVKGITLTRNGEPITISVAKQVPDNIIVISLNETQTAEGEYVLCFAAGSLLGHIDAQRAFTNEEDIELVWTIGEVVDLFAYTTDPEEGEIANFTGFIIDFNNVFAMTIKDETAITLKRNDVPLECNIQRYDANTIWVLVSKTYTEPGTYTLTFPKGSLAACPIDFTEGPTNSKAITMTWTIKDGGVADINAVNKADIRAIYGIDGTRRTALAKGINLVIMADGSRRKIIAKDIN